MIKALEAKKKDFLSLLRDFYNDQRQMVSFERSKACNFLQTIKTSHYDELMRLEQSLEDTHYEDLFKTLSSKSQEIS